MTKKKKHTKNTKKQTWGKPKLDKAFNSKNENDKLQKKEKKWLVPCS